MTAEKPEIDPPDGPPPSDLEVTELSEGDGTEATAGSTVSVHYVGVAHSTGEEFDASYNRGAPLDFRLGVGQVISGWDQGVQGMKVGGRRRLVIPPHLGLRRPRRRRRDQAGRDADLRGGPHRRAVGGAGIPGRPGKPDAGGQNITCQAHELPASPTRSVRFGKSLAEVRRHG